MHVEVVIPEIGEAGMELTFVRWYHEEGAFVEEGEPLFEVDTNKTTLEVEAVASGYLGALRVSEGDSVEPQQVIAVLATNGEEPDAATTPAGAAPDAAVESAEIDSAPAERHDGATGVAPMAGEVSPRARRLARERGLDLRGLEGSGPGGLIAVEDVEATAANFYGRGERTRRAVARRTAEHWRTIPHFHLMSELDITDAVDLGRPTAVLLVAFARALARRDECNLRWEGENLVPREEVSVGVLVDTPEGLLLPVVRSADRFSVDTMDTTVSELAARAREDGLRPVDLGSRSASFSNLGMYPVDRFIGVIAGPDPLLLTVGRARVVPYWHEGEWVPRTVIGVTLSIDHRALDGADGGRLLATLQDLLADPHVHLAPPEIVT